MQNLISHKQVENGQNNVVSDWVRISPFVTACGSLHITHKSGKREQDVIAQKFTIFGFLKLKVPNYQNQN